MNLTVNAEFARGEWTSRAENFTLAGPIGTGKTHLAIAFDIKAARLRRRVLFACAADLVRSLADRYQRPSTAQPASPRKERATE